ncbi:metallophosphoesterase [Paraliobacillus ryukyuensis]|uniref:metallophosphoesterase n=1 Tax=Paraliobacillus ryukyuensis TaxID=200904 RepID=UPI0009A7FB83|nr:metallophosphoesterase [Paraliobacillus ryukyuensis]
MRILYISLFLFIFIGCSSEHITESEPSYSFKQPNDPSLVSESDATFYITTDWHYLAKDLNDNGEAFQTYLTSGDGKQLKEMGTLLDTFAFEVQEKRPSVVIISGDLTNNGAKQSHQAIAGRLQQMEADGTKVYVIPGNHDIANPWARKFRNTEQVKVHSITANEFSTIYQNFGYKEAIAKDPKSLSYLVTPTKDVWLLMLDTTHYQNNEEQGNPEVSGSLSSETLKWIEACFTFAEKHHAKLIPVMHHNLAEHNPLLHEGYTLNNSAEVAELLQKYHTPFVFSGHIHAQDIHQTKGIYDIASNALSIYPHQYGVLSYNGMDSDFSYKTKQLDVATWAKNAGVTDKNLLEFDQFSEKYFADHSAKMVQNLSMPDSDKAMLAKQIARLNQRFFSGTEYLNQEDVLLDPSFEKLLDKTEGTFLHRYIESILYDNNSNDNELHIKQNK